MTLGQTIRYNRKKLRHLTQRQLAGLCGVSTSAIKQYERDAIGSERPNLHILRRLANALDIDINELCAVAIPRRDVAKGFAAATVAGVAATRDWRDLTVSSLVADELPTKSAQQLAEEAHQHLWQREWLKAQEKGKTAATQFQPGSTDWAKVLIDISLAAQQAGALGDANRFRHLVKTKYVDSQPASNSDPIVLSRYHNLDGWIKAEHQGDFAGARAAFNSSLSYAQGAGDRFLQFLNHHWLLVATTYLVGHQSGAIFSATPTSACLISRYSRADLERSIHEDWTRWSSEWEGTIHHYLRKFEADAVLGTRSAFSDLKRQESRFKDSQLEHFVDLSEARCAVSESDWSLAAEKAKAARFGYYRQRFPHGIAMSAAIEGAALARQGVGNINRLLKSLDLLALAILIYPYKGHPLWMRAAWNFFHIMTHARHAFGASWREDYYNDLGERIHAQKEVFAGLQYIDVWLTVDPVGELRNAAEPWGLVHAKDAWLRL